MLSTIFSLLVVPAVVAFALGLIAGAFRTMALKGQKQPQKQES